MRLARIAHRPHETRLRIGELCGLVRAGCAVLAVTLLAACDAAQPPADTGTDSAAAIELVPLTHEQWSTTLAAYQPNVVVVDMWATWCAPCVERFPKMVTLHERYASKGVTIVGMSLEDRDDAGAVAGAADFLVRQDARFPNFLMDENILDSFDKLDILGIPAVDIYDQRGKLRYRLTGDDPNDQFTYADIEAAILSLLAEA